MKISDKEDLKTTKYLDMETYGLLIYPKRIRSQGMEHVDPSEWDTQSIA